MYTILIHSVTLASVVSMLFLTLLSTYAHAFCREGPTCYV